MYNNSVVNVSYLQLYRVSETFPCDQPDSFFLPPVGPDELHDTHDRSSKGNENGNESLEVEAFLQYRKQPKKLKQLQNRPQQLKSAQQHLDL